MQCNLLLKLSGELAPERTNKEQQQFDIGISLIEFHSKYSIGYFKGIFFFDNEIPFAFVHIFIKLN